MICQSILCICDVLLTSRFNRERAVTDTDSVSQSIIVFQLVFVIMANLGEGRQQWTQWTTMDYNQNVKGISMSNVKCHGISMSNFKCQVSNVMAMAYQCQMSYIKYQMQNAKSVDLLGSQLIL